MTYLQYIYKKIQHKMPLKALSELEQKQIDSLRKEIKTLETDQNDAITSEHTEDAWLKNIRQLREKIINQDPRNFLNWDVIQHTMFHQCKKVELDYLKKMKRWDKFNEALTESRIGNPLPYKHLPTSSGNLIHQAYNFAQILNEFDFQINDIKTIFEFGGGYGAMSYFLFNYGFSGKYIIFDLPEFAALQKYYLNASGIDENKNLSTVSSIQELSQILDENNVDIFIANWSLSEVPINTRQKIINTIPNCKYYLIAYQENFKSINNIEYFKKFINERNNYQWINKEISHLPGNFYLLGKKH